MGDFGKIENGNYVAQNFRFKRTTPFDDQCAFVHDTGWGEMEPCESKANSVYISAMMQWLE
jgi:hypothetical protein